MGSRRKSREYLLQMLFQCDMGRQSAEQVQRSFWQQREGVEAEARGYADDLFRAATQRAAEIDALIQAHAAHWKLERMAAVDRNILRAAVTEFLAVPETPRPIIINEALEIARRFSSPESVHFINGVLDSISKNSSQLPASSSKEKPKPKSAKSAKGEPRQVKSH